MDFPLYHWLPAFPKLRRSGYASKPDSLFPSGKAAMDYWERVILREAQIN
ncbi:hypothetical protein CES86_1784 [Brucella lupini]|uniref:Uncharacterized protein n=1 Tax=Brucella lupini TaxID=255457 RepID=A0A256GTI8_9HYPH|nr:hypothetical protein CES86_1784 [Brucella lupini]